MLTPPDHPQPGPTQPGAPPCGRVVRLPPRSASMGFTTRDLIELAAWPAPCRRLGIEAPAPEHPSFALLYAGEQAWAQWGLARHAAGVVLWDCVTHADIGRFDTVRAALVAVQGRMAGQTPPQRARWVAEIIPLRPIALAG